MLKLKSILKQCFKFFSAKYSVCELSRIVSIRVISFTQFFCSRYHIPNNKFSTKTRCISRKGFSGSTKWCNESLVITRSNVSSSKGKHSAFPDTNDMF